MEHLSHLNLNFDYPDGAALARRFPYMFDKPHIGFDFYRGWQSILSGVCVALDDLFKAEVGHDYDGFAWRQIKEKFGTARFYYRLTKPEVEPSRIILLEHSQRARRTLADWDALSDAVDELVSAGEVATQTACMACGEKADQGSGRGWITTLCDKHRIYVSDAVEDEQRRKFREWIHLPGIEDVPGKAR
jgi:hypothetical protein